MNNIKQSLKGNSFKKENIAHWWHLKKLREERLEAERRRQVQEWERAVIYRVPIKFKDGYISYDGHLVIRKTGYLNYTIYLFKKTGSGPNDWDQPGEWGIGDLTITLNKPSKTLTISDFRHKYTIVSNNAEEIYNTLRNIGVQDKVK